MSARASAIRIVTDTTACLPADFARRHNVEIVPQVIRFGEDSYLEEVELSYADFIQRLRTSAGLPSTAAPLPGDFVRAYERQTAAAQTVLSIHPSTEVSGTVRSAMTAKAEAFPQADIRILDTRTVAGNLASLVIAATEWAEAGTGADEIMSRLEAMIPRGRTFFLVATLEYLQKGGRIGGASALLGGALQIRPILQLVDGRVEVLEKVRTRARALERLKELVVQECPRGADGRLSVMHADDAAEAEALAAALQAALGLPDVPLYGLGSAITTHGGPGTLAVGFFVG